MGVAHVIVRDARVAEFVGGEIGVIFSPPLSCIGIEKDGEIIGGAVFNNYEGKDIHLSAAGRGWTRGFLAEVGHYVYTVLDCQRMTVITAHPGVVRLAERLGGQIEGCLRRHFQDGQDAFIVGILKHEYKW